MSIQYDKYITTMLFLLKVIRLRIRLEHMTLQTTFIQHNVVGVERQKTRIKKQEKVTGDNKNNQLDRNASGT